MVKVQVPRLESLQMVSERYNSDPFTLSLKVRKKFRQEKKIENARIAADNEVKSRYALPEDLHLAADNEDTKAEAKLEWEKERQRLRLSDGVKKRRLGAPSPSSASQPATRHSAASSLRAQILANSARPPAAVNGSSKTPPVIKKR
jgi:coiled-coil domain-containing protein 130